MSNGPIEGPLNRFCSLCVTFAVAVAILQWAVVRFVVVMAQLAPFIVFGAVVYGFLRWQRR